MEHEDDVERLFSWLKTPELRYREFAGQRQIADAGGSGSRRPRAVSRPVEAATEPMPAASEPHADTARAATAPASSSGDWMMSVLGRRVRAARVDRDQPSPPDMTDHDRSAAPTEAERTAAAARAQAEMAADADRRREQIAAARTVRSAARPTYEEPVASHPAPADPGPLVTPDRNSPLFGLRDRRDHAEGEDVDRRARPLGALFSRIAGTDDQPTGRSQDAADPGSRASSNRPR